MGRQQIQPGERMAAVSLTGAHISRALHVAGAGSGLVMPVDKIADAFNTAMLRYGHGQFDTTNKVAALVSECMMESAYFRTTEEFNKTHGDYQPYRGRTFIQITWKSNYDKFGVWCRQHGLVTSADTFSRNPGSLAALEWAAIGGVWYFTQVMFHGKPLTAYSNNIEQVGKAVNLGNPFSPHPLKSLGVRKDAYEAVRALGPTIIPTRQTSGGYDMAAATGVYARANAVLQTLAAGKHQLAINNGPNGDGKSPGISLVSGPNDGVDITTGIVVDSDQGGKVRMVLVNFDKDGKNLGVHHERVGVSFGPGTNVEVSATYKGSIGKSPTPGGQLRLRVQIEAFGAATVKDVQSSGWKM